MDVIKWRKARRSDGQGGACVEVARFPDAVAVRDSKNPDGPKLLLTPHTFRAILHDLKH
ncbi:DUF397 domain-containing protein [Actinomadura sp. BRA 177]|uniref:DUF397 domain-containing protein n=1 Tax=Actinomadura sp. BRA 177 TaxID=2745202 RepID=UPI00159572D7|nr:DUF397 domain-containing protein [Actinomadura sp. BRA 177]NVI92244.1 DUF397 domain-containing protein [Actinomadura sp. BRA 177]